MATYNGHKSWNAWNVSLWINNDEGLYLLAVDCRKRFKNAGAAARAFIRECGMTTTPDGGKFNQTVVRLAITDIN